VSRHSQSDINLSVIRAEDDVQVHISVPFGFSAWFTMPRVYVNADTSLLFTEAICQVIKKVVGVDRATELIVDLNKRLEGHR